MPLRIHHQVGQMVQSDHATPPSIAHLVPVGFLFSTGQGAILPILVRLAGCVCVSARAYPVHSQYHNLEYQDTDFQNKTSPETELGAG